MTTTTAASDAYAKFLDHVRDIFRLRSVIALLDWDQETQMPKHGVRARAEQISMMSGLAHDRLVSDDTRRLMEAVKTDGHYERETNLRETRRQYERAIRVPTRLVMDIAHTSTLAKDAWQEARQQKDFSKFAPLLGKLLDLKREQADRIGYETEAYDALLDEYEPGAKAAEIEQLFDGLQKATVSLLQRIAGAKTKPDFSILSRRFPRAAQQELSRKMAEAVNFDFSAGRQDVSAHPFCTTIGGAGDVRITTRYNERYLPSAMYGTLHECGHALYEQGLPIEHLFTPMAEAVSLGIHESQSLMWENMVGRSRAFLEHHYPTIQKMFPDALGNVSLHAFYGAINTVQPSFIRVEADEVTYNLHIVLRFGLERAMLSRKLEVRDVPSAWNERFKGLLGLTPPDDAQGCLQDIHWSMGAIGYFPTYTLGKLYAAQFFAQASKDIPDLPDRIRRNDLRALLSWLRENIHRHGQRYRAHELVQKVTGKSLTIEPFMQYVTGKCQEIYKL